MSEILRSAPAEFSQIDFANLPGLSSENLTGFWRAFLLSCARLVASPPALRLAKPPPARLLILAERAIRASNASQHEVGRFLSDFFRVLRICPRADLNPYPHGFVTGYYEPVVQASHTAAPGFNQPVRARPADLLNAPITLGDVTYSACRQDSDGQKVPYWTRAEIDAGRSDAAEIVWLRDAIEAFMIHVQGSARVTFPDGSCARLRYDGRNGHPYQSIGKILIDEGHIPLAGMSLDALKAWVRQAGQSPDEAGRALLHRNASYVFFKMVADPDPGQGPIGGEGVPLKKLRSLAIDRSIWPYGLPFWVSGELPTEEGATGQFGRMMVAQDTGSAIVGAARGDIFFGSGEIAGRAAARVRHQVDMFVLIPRE